MGERRSELHARRHESELHQGLRTRQHLAAAAHQAQQRAELGVGEVGRSAVEVERGLAPVVMRTVFLKAAATEEIYSLAQLAACPM